MSYLALLLFVASHTPAVTDGPQIRRALRLRAEPAPVARALVTAAVRPCEIPPSRAAAAAPRLLRPYLAGSLHEPVRGFAFAAGAGFMFH